MEQNSTNVALRYIFLVLFSVILVKVLTRTERTNIVIVIQNTLQSNIFLF